jgi:hypothetical protein
LSPRIKIDYNTHPYLEVQQRPKKPRQLKMKPQLLKGKRMEKQQLSRISYLELQVKQQKQRKVLRKK